MYCPKCGKQIIQPAHYCPYCGYDLTGTVSGNYKLVLVSAGRCSEDTCCDLLMDVLGYTSERAYRLVSMTPVEIAKDLTGEQADVIAQMFTEYGAKVSILDENDEYAERNASSSSIFNDDGTLIATAAAVIGSLAIANQVNEYRRFNDRPGLFDRWYHTIFEPVPPRHRPHRPDPGMDPERRGGPHGPGHGPGGPRG